MFLGREKAMVNCVIPILSHISQQVSQKIERMDWGEKLFGTKEAANWMIFRNASGGIIPHWGTRDIRVTSLFGTQAVMGEYDLEVLLKRILI